MELLPFVGRKRHAQHHNYGNNGRYILIDGTSVEFMDTSRPDAFLGKQGARGPKLRIVLTHAIMNVPAVRKIDFLRMVSGAKSRAAR